MTLKFNSFKKQTKQDLHYREYFFIQIRSPFFVTNGGKSVDVALHPFSSVK